ncbi:MAG: RNA polymerase sigma factor [Phycisphaerales bacterium]
MAGLEEHVSLLADAYPRMVAFARTKVGDESAEDVAQEAVMRLLRYRGIEDSQSMSLLLTIVHNVACTWVSREKRCSVWREELDEDQAPHQPRAEIGAHRFSECWGGLNERQREVLLLTEVKGLTEEQAGLVLGVSRSAVGAHRRAAVERLKSACDRRREAS